LTKLQASLLLKHAYLRQSSLPYTKTLLSLLVICFELVKHLVKVVLSGVQILEFLQFHGMILLCICLNN